MRLKGVFEGVPSMTGNTLNLKSQSSRRLPYGYFVTTSAQLTTLCLVFAGLILSHDLFCIAYSCVFGQMLFMSDATLTLVILNPDRKL